jgi:hypothetical protein
MIGFAAIAAHRIRSYASYRVMLCFFSLRFEETQVGWNRIA